MKYPRTPAFFDQVIHVTGHCLIIITIGVVDQPEVVDDQTIEGGPENPEKGLILQDIEVNGELVNMTEAENDLDSSGEAIGED